jgi:hypothetical protein
MLDPTYPTNPVTGGPIVDDPYHRYEPVEPPAPRATWMDRVDSGKWSFFGGLAGGVMILIAAFVTALFLTAMATFAGGIPTWDWFGDDAGDRADNGWPEVPIFIGVWGLVTGGAVILAAMATKERPDASAMPGLVMIVAGLASFFAMGGFIVGGLLAIAAGVLAMAGSRGMWRVRAPRVRDYA